MKMEYRKIIEFGKSSFVVSLPKDWLSQNKIKKGDSVSVEPQGEKIILYPAGKSSSNEPRKITIDVTNLTQQEIRMQLIARYIQNYNEITLKSENMKSRAKDVRSIIHDLMALEVVQEDAEKIVTKDFLNMAEIDPLNLIHKIDLITRDMLTDAKDSFEEDRHVNISERDEDVNRLAYLIFRTMTYFQKNPSVVANKGLTHDRFIAVWTAAINIEAIADQAKRIARLLKWTKLDKDEVKEFKDLYSSIEKHYAESMQVFYDNDQKKAFKLVIAQKKLLKQCRDFDRQNWSHEGVSVILEKIKTIIESTKYILMYVGCTE